MEAIAEGDEVAPEGEEATCKSRAASLSSFALNGQSQFQWSKNTKTVRLVKRSESQLQLSESAEKLSD